MSLAPDLNYWLTATNMKAVNLRRGLDYFADIKVLLHASAADLLAAGFTSKAIQAIQTATITPHVETIKWCEQAQCQIITFHDARYPLMLKELNDAPLVLFVQGNPDILQAAQIAMVGTRNPTPSGRENARQFAGALSQAGLIVTSGLAIGIDAASHQGALAVNAPTIAVLGSGLAQIYPASHQHLAKQIIQSGALVSEFFPWITPATYNFPRRNRIISGMSLGVFVVEATLRSGSLITARFAAEQGREVFALPGSIHNPQARGCHQLIRQGAKLVETAADITEELGALHQALAQPTSKNSSTNPNNLDKKHLELLSYIGFEVTPMDILVARSGLTVSQVSSMLLSLELWSYVNFTPGGYVRVTANSR